MESIFKIIIVAVVLAVVAAIGVSALDNNTSDNSGNSRGAGKIAASETKFDLGTISMAKGKVTHTVKIKNEGSGDLEIKSGSTSCMCTTAKVKADGAESPEFGMNMSGMSNPYWGGKIGAGKSADVEITFDPNAHGPDAVGPITRSVFLQTDDPAHKKFEIMFSGNVTH